MFRHLLSNTSFNYLLIGVSFGENQCISSIFMSAGLREVEGLEESGCGIGRRNMQKVSELLVRDGIPQQKAIVMQCFDMRFFAGYLAFRTSPGANHSFKRQIGARRAEYARKNFRLINLES